MAQERRFTARMEEIEQATTRVGVRQHRLEWAVQFAQEDFDALSPGQWLDRRLELLAFFRLTPQGISAEAEGVELPTAEAMRAIQHAFEDLIGNVLRQEPVFLGERKTTTHLVWMPGPRGIKPKPRVLEVPEPNARLDPQEETTEEVRRDLARLVAEMYQEGRTIKVCDAPKPRARAEERCGRWFVGRPNQTYCSPACRNLANTRATRAKQPRKRRRRA